MLSKKRNYIRGVADIGVADIGVADIGVADIGVADIGVADIDVSVDGTWQKRGYTSLNGVIVAISIDIGKIVNLEILTRYSRQCDIQNKLLKTTLKR